MTTQNLYVVIGFKKNNKDELYYDKIIGVYTTAEKADKAYYDANTFCLIVIKELDK